MFGCQTIPKKLITRANMSCVIFDIQKSKLIVVELHCTKAGKTYNCLVFSTNYGIISCENKFWKEKPILDTNANINALSTNFQQIAWVDDFKQSTSPYL
jgi:hypothetical protein